MKKNKFFFQLLIQLNKKLLKKLNNLKVHKVLQLKIMIVI